MNVPSVFLSRWEVLSITQMPPYPPLGKKSICLRIWNQFYPHWNYVKWLASTGWNNSGLTNCAVEVDWAYAAAARVIRQSVWLCLAREWHKEVPRRGEFPENSENSQRDHQRDHRSNESQSIVLRFNGCHLHRNLLDTMHFLCFCLLVLKIFTRYCNLWEAFCQSSKPWSQFVSILEIWWWIWMILNDDLCMKLLAWFRVSFVVKNLPAGATPRVCFLPHVTGPKLTGAGRIWAVGRGTFPTMCSMVVVFSNRL